MITLVDKKEKPKNKWIKKGAEKKTPKKKSMEERAGTMYGKKKNGY